jgi:hypothetical protein
MAARNARSIVFRRDDDRIGLLGAGRDLVQHAVRVRLQPRHVGEGMQRRDLPRAAAQPRRGRRWWRSGTARRGTVWSRRRRRVCARARPNVSGRGPRPPLTNRASGSSGRAARG